MFREFSHKSISSLWLDIMEFSFSHCPGHLVGQNVCTFSSSGWGGLGKYFNISVVNDTGMYVCYFW